MAKTSRKKYPTDFIARVKAEFPKRSNPMMHKALDTGSEFVGRILSDGCSHLNPEDVVKMIEGGKIHLLLKKAQNYIEVQRLYEEWGRLADKMFYEKD